MTTFRLSSRPRLGATLLFTLSASALLASAATCGGKAVVDEVAAGGAGGITSSTTTSSTTTSSTTTTTTTSSTTTSSTTTNTGGAPPIPPLVEEGLGSVAMGAAAAFDLPPNVLGFTAVAHSNNIWGSIGIEEIEAPDGALLVQGFGIPGTSAQYLYYGVITAAVPQTDHPQAMPLMPSTWHFRLGSEESPPSAQLSVWYRQTLDGQFHGGLIDVNVFAVAGFDESYLDQLVHASFDGVAGLAVGNLNHLPLSNQFSTVDLYNYPDVFEATAGAPGKPALNVMAVNFIDLDEPGVLGFSPGAPGLPLEHGTLQSAVVMTISGDLSLDRMVLRHESGHFAGLYHTSEIEPGFTDYLDDTPVCPDVDAMYPNCPDVDNLMFPYADPNSPMQLSAKQRRVVHGSALYRGAVEEGGGFPPPLDQTDNAAAWDGAEMALVAPLSIPAADTSWKAFHDSEVLDLLGRLWCGQSAAGAYQLLRNTGVTEAELLAMGLDARLPDHVRMRALLAMARGNPTPAETQRLEQIALDQAEPRLLRISATSALARLSPTRPAALGLDADPDPAVARVARRR